MEGRPKLVETPDLPAESVADGFGNEWRRCAHPKCDLHVVRPGKAQCSNYCWFEFDTAFPGELIDGRSCDASD